VSAQRTFIGRARELELLHGGFSAARDGAGYSMLVTGESGVGKSALVRRFTSTLSSKEPGLVVLKGRCYERESVPYKAFDGIVDSIARLLAHLPKGEAAALVPDEAPLLADVFPVLNRAAPIAALPRPSERGRDPLERRALVFRGFRELMRRWASARPLLVWIDDMQWADMESLALMQALMRPPLAPRILLLSRLDLPRSPPRRRVCPARWWDRKGTCPSGCWIRRRRAPWPDTSSRRAACTAWTRRSSSPRPAATRSSSTSSSATHSITLRATARACTSKRALQARIRDLEPPARRLLELVSLAGGPIGQGTAAQAADLGADFARQLGALRVAHLVRTNGSREDDTVEAYHDRVRRAALGTLERDLEPALHRRLAIALESGRTAGPRGAGLALGARR
jgi:predicted ATPase